MRLTPLGEELIILEDLGDLAPSAVCSWLESLGLPGVVEAAPAWKSVGLHLDAEAFSPSALDKALSRLDLENLHMNPGNELRIPVCWELGLDTKAAAEACRISPDSLITLLESEPWPCRFIGFQPGFPYCGPLPSPLDQIPRLDSPRTKVRAGSVAVAAGQIGIYPADSPGGWMVLGQTPLTICIPSEPYFPILPGDRLSFYGISRAEFDDRQGEVL